MPAGAEVISIIGAINYAYVLSFPREAGQIGQLVYRYCKDISLLSLWLRDDQAWNSQTKTLCNHLNASRKSD
jgi:hypothetical protein